MEKGGGGVCREGRMDGEGWRGSGNGRADCRRVKGMQHGWMMREEGRWRVHAILMTEDLVQYVGH